MCPRGIRLTSPSGGRQHATGSAQACPLVPGAPMGLRQLGDAKVPSVGSTGLRIIVPRAAIGTCPLENAKVYLPLAERIQLHVS